jgi:Phage derived protein Gp49-like (DUF891)
LAATASASIGTPPGGSCGAWRARRASTGLPVARHLRGDIYEVRATGAHSAYRVLFATEGSRGQVLLAVSAFSKKTHKTLPREIALAQRRLADRPRRGRLDRHVPHRGGTRASRTRAPTRRASAHGRAHTVAAGAADGHQPGSGHPARIRRRHPTLNRRPLRGSRRNENRVDARTISQVARPEDRQAQPPDINRIAAGVCPPADAQSAAAERPTGRPPTRRSVRRDRLRRSPRVAHLAPNDDGTRRAFYAARGGVRRERWIGRSEYGVVGRAGKRPTDDGCQRPPEIARWRPPSAQRRPARLVRFPMTCPARSGLDIGHYVRMSRRYCKTVA